MAQEAGALPKVIRDPVHNLIALDDSEEGRLVLELIQTPEMQRLRRVRQLGMSCLTYPGAEHSRFTHSLGVFHVARRMLDALSERQDEAPQLYGPLQDKRRTILAAALLHDIGHGPFSHVFERALPKPANPPEGHPQNHEGWTARIIRDSLSNICSQYGVDATLVASLITGSGGDLLARDFISSQLDADRLDYLLRDSHAAGVSYGVYDMEWLIHSLRVGAVELPGIVGRVPRLSFRHPKALAVIEGFIEARRAMYVQVYMHKTTRAYEAQLRHLLGLAGHTLQSGVDVPGDCPDPLRRALMGIPLEVDEYLALDDFAIWSTVRSWAANGGKVENDLQRRLARKAADIVHRRRPYRVLPVPEAQQETAVAVEVILEQQGDLTRFYCARDKYKDVPYKNIFYQTGGEAEDVQARAIHLLDDDGHTWLVEQKSELIRKVSDVPMEVYRMFYDEAEPAAVQVLEKHGLKGA